VFKILKRLVPKPFEFATSVMNVDSKCTAHSKDNIPYSKKFFIVVSYWLVFTFLVSYWSAFTVSFQIRIAENTPTSRFLYPHHEGA
jgi:hypothetical protein